jgi:hypothetical protein
MYLLRSSGAFLHLGKQLDSKCFHLFLKGNSISFNISHAHIPTRSEYVIVLGYFLECSCFAVPCYVFVNPLLLFSSPCMINLCDPRRSVPHAHEQSSFPSPMHR